MKAKLTEIQLGIFTECMTNPESSMYNIPMITRLDDDVDVMRLKDAILKAETVHPALSSRLEEGDDWNIYQVSGYEVPVDIIELSDDEFSDRTKFLIRLFKLIGGPLARFEIYVTPSAKYLFWDIHHLIFDGTSAKVLSQCISDIYDGRVPVAETVSFEDLSESENTITDECRKNAWSFYDRLFSGTVDDTIPERDVHADTPSEGCIIREFTIDAAKLKDMRSSIGFSTSAFFTAAMGVTVAAFNGTGRSFISTVHNGRDSDNINTLTMLVRTHPFITDLNGNGTVSELLKNANESLSGCYKNTQVPFSKICSRYSVSSDISFAYQGRYLDYTMFKGHEYGAEMLFDDRYIRNSKMVFEVCDLGSGRYRSILRYRSDYYSDGFVSSFTDAYVKTVEGLMSKEDVKDICPSMSRNVSALDRMMADYETQSSITPDLNGNPEKGHPAGIVIPIDRQKAESFCRDAGVTSCDLYLAASFYTLSRFIDSRDIYISILSGELSADGPLPIGLSISEVSVREFIGNVSELYADLKSPAPYQSRAVNERYGYSSKFVYVYQRDTVSNDLTSDIYIFEAADGKGIEICYNDALYSRGLMELFAKCIVNVSENMITSPDSRIRKVSMMDTAMSAVTERFSVSAKSDINVKILHKKFELQADAHPDKVILHAHDGSYTYAQLESRANRIANFLISKGVGKGDRILILLNRTSNFFASMFGVLKAGAAYIPSCPEYPKERIDSILEDSEAKFVITEKELMDVYDRTLLIDNILSYEDDSRPAVNVSPEDTAYMIYTSGSTGKPKGVILRHIGIANYLTDHPSNLQVHMVLEYGHCYGSMTTVSFDMSIKEAVVSLCNGIELAFADDEQCRDPMKMTAFFREHDVDVINGTPSRIMQYAELDEFAELLKDCKCILCGGEKYPDTLLTYLQKNTCAHIINTYGPTEITVSSNMKDLTKSTSVSVGRPGLNYIEHIVDSDDNILPPGIVGELLISGCGVAEGYNKLPDKTKAAFIEFNGMRTYRSGDYARWTPDGDVVVLGRKDGQVKLRGLRIELGEIEKVLSQTDGIRMSCVLIKKLGKEDGLCAYFTADRTIDHDQLKAELAKTLPDYMVPSAYVQLERMPVTNNGKIDFKNLPAPVLKKKTVAERRMTPIEKKIHGIVSGIVGDDTFGPDDPLINAGLTSLTSIKLIVAVNKAFGYRVDMSDLMKGMTVASLSELIEEHLISGLNTGKETQKKETDKNSRRPSSVQLGVYMDCMRRPDTILYNIPWMLTFPTEADAERLASCVDRVVAAHPYICTSISAEGEDIHQRYVDVSEFSTSLSEMTEAEFSKFKDRFVRPFVLSEPYLFRFSVVRTSEHVYLLADFHHIIFDGGSSAILLSQIKTLYEGGTIEKERYSYYDYVDDEVAYEGSEEYTESGQFFDRMLRDYETPSEITPDLNGSFDDGRLAGVSVPIDLEKATAFCRSIGVTPAHLYLAATFYTLSRFIDSRNVYISTISNGRSNIDLADSFGMFVRTLPIGISVDDVTVKDFIKCSADVFLGAIKNEAYPYVKISQKYGYSPKFMYEYQVGVVENNSIGGMDAERSYLTIDRPKFSASLHVSTGRDGGTEIVVEYNNALYSKDLMETFAKCVVNVSENMMAAPESRVRRISMMDAVMAASTEALSVTATDDISVRLLHKMFERHVDANPEKVILHAHDGSFTYAQLENRANRVANFLISKGVGKGDRILILLNRTSNFFVSMFGVLKSGAAYIPSCPDYPKERIDSIIEDSEAKFVITEKELMGTYERTVLIDDILSYDDESRPDVNVSPEDTAYMIYTSGSTGKPKGVILRHIGIANYLTDHPANIQVHTVLEYGHCYGSITTVAFDMSLKESVMSLCNGFELAFADDEQCRDPVKMTKFFREHNVDVINGTPSRIMQYAELDEFAEFLKGCNCILSGGERYPDALLQYLQKNTHAHIINTYGPTEITVSSNMKDLTKASSVSVGRPVLNYIEHIVDSDDNLLPPGVVGELLISGCGVGEGYNKLPEKTKAAFIEFNGMRTYRSGDYARWTFDGDVAILSRKDGQVKLRGLRIELGEIEKALSQANGIRMSCVLIKKLGREDGLCAYFTADHAVDHDSLKAELAKLLPDYMVPAAYMQLEKMPMTNNGKIDFKHLPEPQVIGNKAGRAPANDTERMICDIFKDILGTDEIYADSNFFENGGSSLLVVRVTIQATKRGLPITYGDVFANQTPEELAKLVAKDEPASEPLIPGLDNIGDYDYTKINDVLKMNNLDSFRNGKMQELGDVLLMGSTGFLGVHILRQLLEAYDVKVTCMLRSKKGNSASERLRSLYYYYFEKDPFADYGERLKVFEGDVTSPESFACLDDVHIDTVINCAANVKHFSKGTDIEDVNYYGGLNLLALCKSKGCRLIHVSTMSVGGRVPAEGSKVTHLHEDQLYFGQKEGSKYTLSKFLTERAILEEVANGFNAKIMRVGTLSARDVDGEYQANLYMNSFMGRLKSTYLIGEYPYEAIDSKVEFSPIDSVSEAILLLAQTPKECTVFHPFNNHPVMLGDIYRQMDRCGLACRAVEMPEYRDSLEKVKQDPVKAQMLSGLIAYDNSVHGEKVVGVEKSNAYTMQVLYRLGFTWPLTSNDYVKRFIDVLIGMGYFDV